jgi:Tfp pilus assembly protein PilP
MTGAGWAQNPDAVDNARSVAKSLQQKQANDTNAALNVAGTPAAASQPASQSGSQSGSAGKTPASATGPAKAPGAGKKSAKPRPVIVAKEPAPAKSGDPFGAKTATDGKNAVAQGQAKDVDAKGEDASKPKAESKKWSMTGKRDPFFSPVVQQASGSGCSTGKKCLEIGQINLRGVVKSESGFIAVVTNSINKAYFLHENDPVFNGYVVKITGDSVVFQETVQDKLGKPLTREVVKRLFTPAV